MKLKNLRIQSQLKLSLIIFFSLFLIISFNSYFQAKSLQENTNMLYNHSLKVRRLIGDLNAQVLSARIEFRNIILSNDNTAFNQSSIQREIHYENALSIIDQIYNYYTGDKQEIKDIRGSLVKWNRLQIEELDKLKTTEDINLLNFSDLINKIEKHGTIGQAREDLIEKINTISNYSKNKADLFYQNSNETFTKLIIQFFILIGIALFVALVSARLLIKNIKTPLNELLRTTLEFQKGNYNSRSSYSLDNEFGILSNSFNSLANNIQYKIELDYKINHFTKEIFHESEAKQFSKSILKTLLEQTESQVGAIYVLNEEKTCFYRYSSIGIKTKICKKFSATELEGEIGLAVFTKKIQHVKQINNNHNLASDGILGKILPKEVINIPIIFKNETVAVVSLGSFSNFSNASIDLIENIHYLLNSRFYAVFAFSKLNKAIKELEKQNIELEQQRIELNSLAAELKSQNSELEVQKNQLFNASKLKTTFLSNMSHELRTPLNSVIALSSVLSRNLKNQINEEQFSYIEIIEKNGKHLLNLINDILDIQKIESGNEEINLKEFNPNQAIEDLVILLKAQAEKKKINLTLSKCNLNQDINCDIKMFNHIFQNLIGNAIKFTEVGEVNISLSKIENKLVVIVKDTGIGIDKQNIEYIFDEFKQIDSSNTKKYEGTGLGLSIAKKYIEILGGQIFVESELGKGTTFTVELPCQYSDENKKNKSEREQHQYFNILETKDIDLTNLKALIVEDSEAAIIQIKDILQSNKIETEIAHNGKEAIEILNSYTPDLIILDLMMPEIDGFETLKQIRSMEKTSNIPVIILTAKFITKAELSELKRNNIFQILQKGNVEKDHLVNTIKNIVLKNEQELKSKQLNITNLNKNKILIVEDNIDNLTTLKAILPKDFEIIETTNGENALELAINHKPYLILMDLALKNISGLDIMKKIKSQSELKETKIIVVTASALADDKQKLLSEGFDGYISKPIDLESFTSYLNQFYH